MPPSAPLIRSEHGKSLDKVSEPVQEGSTLTLICETQGGEPLPRLTWKRGQATLDDVVEEVDPQNRVVRNYLKMRSLHRKDHDDVLSCLASNTNLTTPQITYININMVCKYRLEVLDNTFRVFSELPDISLQNDEKAIEKSHKNKIFINTDHVNIMNPKFSTAHCSVKTDYLDTSYERIL